MSENDDEVDILLSLRREEAEILRTIASSRSSLGEADVADIVREAVGKFLEHHGRSAPNRGGRPDRKRVLFDFLFGGSRDETFDRLSVGVCEIIDHASALLDDAAVLAAAKRYERAEFLLATAQEEIGKLYILLDMCRVDFAKGQAVLRYLCSAFLQPRAEARLF